VEKVLESSIDTDGQPELPLSSQLQEQVSAIVAKEKASAVKKKSRVWSDDERLMARFLTSHLHQRHAARG